CCKPINGENGERNAHTKEQCVELWNFSSGITYRKKESRYLSPQGREEFSQMEQTFLS
ncbi:hypothetical protein RYX36_012136, partial [Vicia faba]